MVRKTRKTVTQETNYNVISMHQTGKFSISIYHRYISWIEKQ
jgi:hypothetical protein